jgi:hypothetical protein
VNNLSNLLERFYKSLKGDERRKERIQEIILKHTGGRVDVSQILYKEGVLEIEASAVLKNEIRIKEKIVRDELQASSMPVTRILYK